MLTRTIQSLGMGIVAVTTTMAGGVIDESTHIKLGSALAVAGVIIPTAWWLSAKFTRIFARLDQMDEIQKDVARMHDVLKTLPCQTPADDCEEQKPKRK